MPSGLTQKRVIIFFKYKQMKHQEAIMKNAESLIINFLAFIHSEILAQVACFQTYLFVFEELESCALVH